MQAQSTTMTEATINPDDPLLTEADINRIRWRCRRGLLENDIFIERFFARFANELSQADAVALLAMMDLSDNDLLDLHLGRRPLAEVAPQLDNPRSARLLTLLKTPA
jgi:antitoxin CptB